MNIVVKKQWIGTRAIKIRLAPFLLDCPIRTFDSNRHCGCPHIHLSVEPSLAAAIKTSRSAKWDEILTTSKCGQQFLATLRKFSVGLRIITLRRSSSPSVENASPFPPLNPIRYQFLLEVSDASRTENYSTATQL